MNNHLGYTLLPLEAVLAERLGERILRVIKGFILDTWPGEWRVTTEMEHKPC